MSRTRMDRQAKKEGRTYSDSTCPYHETSCACCALPLLLYALRYAVKGLMGSICLDWTWFSSRSTEQKVNEKTPNGLVRKILLVFMA